MSVWDSRARRAVAGQRAARIAASIIVLAALGVLTAMLAACGSSDTTEVSSPSPSPTGPRVYTNDVPPYSFTLPANMKEDPENAPALEGSEAWESSAVFGASSTDNPELKGNVYLYVVAARWGQTILDVKLARQTVTERLVKNMEQTGGKSKVSPLSTEAGLKGDRFMVAGGGAWYFGAVFATSERFYILFYRCEEREDFASPSILAEFLHSVLSFSEAT